MTAKKAQALNVKNVAVLLAAFGVGGLGGNVLIPQTHDAKTGERLAAVEARIENVEKTSARIEEKLDDLTRTLIGRK